MKRHGCVGRSMNGLHRLRGIRNRISTHQSIGYFERPKLSHSPKLTLFFAINPTHIHLIWHIQNYIQYAFLRSAFFFLFIVFGVDSLKLFGRCCRSTLFPIWAIRMIFVSLSHCFYLSHCTVIYFGFYSNLAMRSIDLLHWKIIWFSLNCCDVLL